MIIQTAHTDKELKNKKIRENKNWQAAKKWMPAINYQVIEYDI